MIQGDGFERRGSSWVVVVDYVGGRRNMPAVEFSI